MKKEYIALLVILLIAAGFRLYNLRHEYFIGNDAFLHYSVIRQGLETGDISHYQLSFYEPLVLEPKGFYYVTLIPSLITGLDFSFLIMPFIFGIIGLLFFYFLIKDLFNARVALMTILILSLCVAHMYRTSPNSYRGDGFYLTFLIMILYFFNKSIKGANKHSLITGLLMGLSSTIWNGYPIGILIVVSGLIISSTIEFLKGKYGQKSLVKTVIMLVTYYALEQLFILTGFIQRMFFTNNLLLHSLLVFAPLGIGLIYLLTHKVKKSHVMGVMVVAIIVILILNASTISSMIAEGLFENSLFYDIGVSELLAPEWGDLHALLSWTLYLMWPGVILLVLLNVKKQKPGQLTFLIWVIVSTYLMLSYMRYNFIGSITTASMTSLFFDYLNKKLKKFHKYAGLALFIVFFVPFMIDGFSSIQRVGPRINDPWSEALTWASINLEPGVVLSWWDHGSWIQYYTGMKTVTDSVTGQDQHRIQRTARFLTTSDYDSFADWEADYLILGGDVILYSGAVLGIAGTTGFEVSLAGQASMTEVNGTDIIIVPIAEGQFEVYPEGTVYRDVNGVMVLNKTFLAGSRGVQVVESVYNQTSGCLVVNPYTNLFLNDQACDSNYVKLMYGEGLPGYELLYRNDFVVIYKIL